MKAHSGKLTAFTLLELLVVIAVMAILAAMLFSAIKGIDKGKKIARARTELGQMQTFIESYKARLGYYPPDNRSPIDHQLLPGLNQLYYELNGTLFSGNTFVDKDGVAPPMNASQIASFFGPGVTGFINVDRGNSEEGKGAPRFLRGLKADQIATVGATNGSTRMTVTACLLVCTVPGPDPNSPALNAGSPALNPWQYNSSAPTNNTATYDLWVDIFAGGRIIRICNWSSQPLVIR